MVLKIVDNLHQNYSVLQQNSYCIFMIISGPIYPDSAVPMYKKLRTFLKVNTFYRYWLQKPERYAIRCQAEAKTIHKGKM